MVGRLATFGRGATGRGLAVAACGGRAGTPGGRDGDDRRGPERHAQRAYSMAERVSVDHPVTPPVRGVGAGPFTLVRAVSLRGGRPSAVTVALLMMVPVTVGLTRTRMVSTLS